MKRDVDNAEHLTVCAVEGVELARISGGEGACTFAWPVIEQQAARWTPGCTEFNPCLARLLLAARASGDAA